LNLLECHAERIGKLRLAEVELVAAHAHSPADVLINGVRYLAHQKLSKNASVY
jgi:hypothetical protein